MTPEDLAEEGWLAQPRLSPGFLACLPLFLFYELALFLGEPGMARNGAESVLTSALAPLGDLQQPARAGLVAAVAFVAWLRAREHTELVSPRRLLRQAAEGGLLALVLGPLLLWMLSLFDVPELAWQPLAGRDEAPPLLHALRLLGAAPWEELLFRVGLYGVLYLLARRIAEFLGSGRSLALPFADVSALLLSSLLFAAFHLDGIQDLFDRPGDAFEGTVFLWRLLAGLLLAGIYRWRGLGTAAWTHAVFNLALALGAA